MHPDDTPDLPACHPCPWCGEQPLLEPCQRHGYFVSCDNGACLVQPETRDCETRELAAEAWNGRVAA